MSDELRVSDVEREQAVARLLEASAEGRLTLDELAARTGSAYIAQTRGELVHVTHDLPAATESTPEQKQRPRFVVAVFAPVWRPNRWRLGRRTFVFSLFAPVNVTAPEHVDVQLSAFGIFAPVRELGLPGELPPSAPRVRVNGVSLFAPVFVSFKPS